MERWRNKVAVVTGASAGIGASIAQKLVEEGLQVVGLARRVELVQKLANGLSKKRGKLHAAKCDVSDLENVRSVFKWIKETIGPVQILINNAAYLKKETIIEGDPESLKKVLDVNLYGVTICLKEAVSQMRDSNLEGHIININSVFGHKVMVSDEPYFNMYPSTKFGITALTDQLLQELQYYKTKIKITSLSPGLVHNTEIFNSAKMDELSADVVEKIPHLLPEDIANGVVYVLGTPLRVQVAELIIKPFGTVF